ncbi:hypothetical protein CCP3SC1_50066 [Gammaproteobacteria bacterium]
MRPFLPILADHDEASPDAFVFWGAGRRGILPAAFVLNVSLASDAIPIPFSMLALEGMVAREGVLTPQIDWTVHWGGTRQAGRYRIQVQTSRGPVWFRVDSVARTTLATEDVSTLAEMEELIAPLAVASANSYSASIFRDTWDQEITLLITETQGQTVALPAAAVARVERPSGIWAARQANEYQVALAGELVTGVSLGYWLGHPTSEERENAWALVVAGNNGQVAILTTFVHGLISIPRHHLHRLVRNSGESVWYLDQQRGAIEVLDPTVIAGGQPSALSQLLASPNSPPPGFYEPSGAPLWFWRQPWLDGARWALCLCISRHAGPSGGA